MIREGGISIQTGQTDPAATQPVVPTAVRLFEKYPLSGRTYITSSGEVVPNELQYYDGEMVHLYGDCTNLSAVRDALAGSGHRPVTVTYPGGQRRAIAQLWVSRFTETSIQPYNAMFIVAMAVPEDAPETDASLSGDPSGVSSALVMLDGTYDPARAVYENRRRLFLVRLLDTTQVAIDVGRERMGTDKRRGIIELSREGRRLRLLVADRHHHAVARADIELDEDAPACWSRLERASAMAGVAIRALPAGTEYVYPATARIGHGRPVVHWQWRSDTAPRITQEVAPGNVRLESASDEGRLLLAWGFTPRVLAYFPHVRGVITGLAEHTAAAAPSGAPQVRTQEPRIQAQRDLTSVAPATPAAWLSSSERLPPVRHHDSGGISPQPVPVLRFNPAGTSARPSAPLQTSFPRHSGLPPLLEASPRSSGVDVPVRPDPRWEWNTTFLGTLTVTLRKEVVGVTPDGIRINWHVIDGRFVGRGLAGRMLPGAADWMRIRPDGIAIVDVQACFETTHGARVFVSYGGLVDLGPDGYARALRDEYGEPPPVVVTPTYATADEALSWLNRVQGIGVGRVDVRAQRVELDLYVVRIGPRRREGAGGTG
jgi:hypothetical protein